MKETIVNRFSTAFVSIFLAFMGLSHCSLLYHRRMPGFRQKSKYQLLTQPISMGWGKIEVKYQLPEALYF
jgi:hypothetical protein